MADLINTKFSFIKKTVTPNIEFQGSSTAPKKENPSKFQKLMLPTSLIAGGGLLIYLGIRRPNAESVFNKIIKSHRENIDNEVPNFYEYTENAIGDFLEKSLQKIYQYKKQHLDNIHKKINNPISKALKPMNIIRRQNNAFKILDTDLNPYLKSGASDFDKFIVEISADKKNLKDILSTKQYQVRLKMEDNIEIHTSDYFRKSVGIKKHDELLKKSQNDLQEYINQLQNQMSKFTDKKIYSAINLQSSIMENIIVEIRDLLKETKENTIISAFDKMSAILNIKNFKPSFRNNITLDKFSKLTSDELKPIQIPTELNKMLKENHYFNIIKTLDFNKLDDKTIKNIFYAVSPYDNINNIKYIIDRIRLLNMAEKTNGIDNSKIYKNIIAKMEALYLKLKNFGEKEFLMHCNQNFVSMSEQELRAKLYYMNKISNRLGYHALTQANRNFMRNYVQYSKLPFKKTAEQIRQYPEKYFI